MVLLLLQHRLQLPVFLLQVLNLLRHIRIGRFTVGARQNWLHFVQLLELHLQTIALMGQLFDFILKLQKLELLLINHGDIRLRNRFVNAMGRGQTMRTSGRFHRAHIGAIHLLLAFRRCDTRCGGSHPLSNRFLNWRYRAVEPSIVAIDFQLLSNL